MTSPAAPKRPSRTRASKPAPARQESAPEPKGPPITLVIGTDTRVGKTWITCALARALKDAGQNSIAVKPFEVGCGTTPGHREDGELLAEATGQSAPRRALVRLRAPLAVPAAADLEGVTLNYEAVLGQVREFQRPDSFLLVEGVGGLLAPVTWDDDALDMIHSLNARVLVVAADRLGTINHTLLTLRVLRSEKVPVLGVVLNQPVEPDESSPTNASAITRLSATDLIVRVPYLHDTEHAAEAMKEVAGWLLP
jgi:dethiobiotin synthetase